MQFLPKNGLEWQKGIDISGKVLEIKIVFTPNILFFVKVKFGDEAILGGAHSSSLRRFPVKMTGEAEWA